MHRAQEESSQLKRGIKVLARWKSHFTLFFDTTTGSLYAQGVLMDMPSETGDGSPQECVGVRAKVNRTNPVPKHD